MNTPRTIRPSTAMEEKADEPWTWGEPRWRSAVNQVRAGRSLRPSVWRGGTKVAVAISFDTDHESGTLRNRQASTSPGGLAQGEYGSRVAVPRILRVLARYDIPATYFVPGVVAKLHPEEVRAILDSGHEIGVHGWIHERNVDLTADVERDLTLRAIETLQEVGGKPVCGIRTPSWDFTLHTLGIIRESGILYDSSMMADDDPYELLEEDRPTGIVEVPVEWIRCDNTYFKMDRETTLRPYSSPEAVLEIWKAEFNGALAEGGLFQMTFHPHVIGHRSRIRMLEELLEYVRSHSGVWFATHEQIAKYVAAQVTVQ